MTWTYPPRRILVPVDFGDASARALEVAAVLGAALDAIVDTLHAEVLEAPPYFTVDQVSALEQQRTAARAAAESYLARFADARGVRGGRSLIVDGPAHAAILDRTGQSDLIVMGTHGRRGASRWWLGSVAEKVLRDATVPVLVVRASQESAALPFGKLLVLGPFALGEGFARRYAHAIGDVMNSDVIDGVEPYAEDAARQVGATMLVLPLRAGDRHWFGEHVERLLRRSELPLLFVPDAGGRRRDQHGFQREGSRVQGSDQEEQ